MCNQLREFTENTIDEYKKTIRINKFTKNNPIAEDVEHENFTQIGLRHLIEQEVFDSTTDVYPGIFGLTRSIILGEIHYFVFKILENPEIVPIDVKKNNILPRYLAETVNNWNASIAVSVDIFYQDWLKQKKWWKFIRWDKRDPLLIGIYPIFTIPQKLVNEIKNKIIIYDNKKIVWNFVNFRNEILNRTERLQVTIGELQDDKRDVLIRTVNRLDIDTDFVKVINIIE